MEIMTALEIAAATLAAINLAVSIAVWRSALYEPAQKRLQYLLIWLVPLLGVLAAWMVLREDSWAGRKRRGDGLGANPYSPWNDMSGGEGHSSHHSGGHDGH